ncbi:MAG: F0F1 ATP synthase subunit epsilon [Megasphaera sp.]|jgi:F-type H+-transporting ATPase subunit epsilon|nr:F0F1 ATP synthase subunit epsilon [Megasphaera sp.]MCH4187460.1 F0F1 ATP synthase subunit epsilon [Megasphaera sp.]MCH4217379.1 F0F1 ATP synthase subunit epsilon [Megasphaera sp.]
MAETGKTIRLEVITPDAAVLNEDVNFVLVRALDGDLGILPNHAPLIASLSIWPLEYEQQGQRQAITIAKGFLEVSNNTITVITPAAEKPGDIDVRRAQAAKDRAEKRLSDLNSNIDVERATLALQRALRRIDVAKKYGGQ